MKMTLSMSSICVLLSGQMLMPELRVSFMVGYKLDNTNFHANLDWIDYYWNKVWYWIITLSSR